MRLLFLRSLLKKALPKSAVQKIKIAMTKLEHFGYLNHFDTQKFLHLKTPQWMLDQIDEEFAYFSKKGIDLSDIDRLELHLSKCAQLPKCFLRFRIIDNKIYLKGLSDELDPKFILYKPLFTVLKKINGLPNVDFIFHYFDATPCEGLTPDHFWMKSQILAPLLTYGKLADSQASRGLVSIPCCFSLQLHNAYIDPATKGSDLNPWEKKLERAIWRGSDTDLHLLNRQIEQLTIPEIHSYYQTRPRYRISQISKTSPDYVDAGFSHIGRAVLDPLVADLRKRYLPIESQLQYKYIMSLDGWGWPTNFIWSLASNSLSLKIDPGIVDWYYRPFKPYEHYLPIQKDLSDLVDAIKWAKEHDDQCRQIAINASQLFRKEMTSEHGLLYLQLVLSEYAKHQKFDPRSLQRETRNDRNWSEM